MKIGNETRITDRKRLDELAQAIFGPRHDEFELSGIGQLHEAAALAIRNLEDLVWQVAHSGVEMDDDRLSYVSVQIDADTWRDIKARARYAQPLCESAAPPAPTCGHGNPPADCAFDAAREDRFR